ncbi:hypothetical protein ACHJH3_06155 [Campylobacter sp. MOP7]|uniref:hypothetical protein n=1 Tax=Campylobacter canis TaxID=3378588 RepID=UPI00387E4327
MKNINTRVGTLTIANFEDICSNAEVVLFNENMIEIPGIVTFYKENSINSLTKLMSITDKLIEINEADFQTMTKAIEASMNEPNMLVANIRVKPEKKGVFNLAKIKEDFIFGEQTNSSLVVNNYLFTNSTVEYHGESMFSPKWVFFLSFDEMSKVRDAIFNNL